MLLFGVVCKTENGSPEVSSVKKRGVTSGARGAVAEQHTPTAQIECGTLHAVP
jgi:hypothetical protein